MLSTWPKDGHSVGKLYAPPSLFMQLVFFSRSRSTSWPAWFSDVFLFPKFWHLTNDMIFFRYVICYGRLVHFCCPALSVWPCERSVANRFYFFSVFLLSFPIISASLSNICTLYSYSCGMESCTHILQFAQLCVDLLGGLAVVSVSCRASWPYLFHIYGISSQQSQITLLHMGWLLILYSPVLTCFFSLCLVFFLFWHWSCFTSSKIHFG